MGHTYDVLKLAAASGDPSKEMCMNMLRQSKSFTSKAVLGSDSCSPFTMVTVTSDPAGSLPAVV